MSQKLKFNNPVIIFLIIFSIISCKNKDSDKKDILSKNEFINVLVDIHLANATLNYMQADKNWENFKANDYYPSILKKHNVSGKKFEKTIQYYIKRPIEYDAIYDSVINRLSIMQGNITNKIMDKKKK